MRFTTREDIALPIEDVFAAVSDFHGFERAAMRRGAVIDRTGDHGVPGTGQGWTVQFRYRGRQRELATVIDQYEPPKALGTTGRLGGFEGTLQLELTALSPTSTRMRVDLDVKPRTLTARLMLQSLKLAKSSLTNRFKARVRTFARDLEHPGGGRRS